MSTRGTVIALALAATACSKHEDVQHPTAPLRLDTPGPVAPAPAPPPPRAAQLPIAWDQDLAYLPVDAELVMGVDLAQLRGGVLWKQYAPSLLDRVRDQLAEIQSRCGFDPIEVIAGMTFGVADLAGTPRGTLVIHGVARATMTACLAKAPGATVDGDVIAIKTPDSDVVATALDDSTLLAVAGKGVTKDQLLAAKGGTSALPTSAAFTAMYQLVDKSGSAWLLMNGNAHALSTLKTVAPDMRALFGSVRITDRIALDGRLRMGSQQTATSLAQVAAGQVGQVKSMFERLDVAADADDVHVVLAMTHDQIDNLVAQLVAMMTVQGPRRDAKGR